MVKALSYFKESWQELRQVNWPNRGLSIRLTIAVLVLSLIVGAFIGVIDLGLVEAVKRFIVN